LTVSDSAVQAFLKAAVQLGAASSWVSQVEIGKQVFPDGEGLISSARNVAAECKDRGLTNTSINGTFMLTQAGIKAAKG